MKREMCNTDFLLFKIFVGISSRGLFCKREQKREHCKGLVVVNNVKQFSCSDDGVCRQIVTDGTLTSGFFQTVT